MEEDLKEFKILGCGKDETLKGCPIYIEDIGINKLTNEFVRFVTSLTTKWIYMYGNRLFIR